MIHDARIIPLDERPPLPPTVRLLEGDSRGRWEGDTLVVETTNFGDRNWIATSAASGRIKGIPQSPALRIVERFTRVAPDRIDYEARIEDPQVFTRPWTLAFPLTRDDEYRDLRVRLPRGEPGDRGCPARRPVSGTHGGEAAQRA